MSDSFDPYHRWLGIPPSEQPADCYRLLGLSRFEADPEVIRDAAERQIAHVRRNSLGRHLELAQKLLNELAAAKALLMHPVERAAYDRRLQTQDRSGKRAADASAASSAGPPPSSAAVATSPTPRGVAVVSSVPAAWVAVVRAHPRLAAVAGSGLGAVVLVLIVTLLWPRAPDPAPPRSTAVTPPPPAVAVAQPPPLTETTTPAPAASQDSAVRPPPAPTLAAIPPQTIDEGSEFRLPVVLREDGSPQVKVRYCLGPGSPPGAHIDPDSGLFAWLPTEEQGPGEYPVTVQVLTDDDGPVVSRRDFRITVREANQPPELQPVEDLQVEIGEVHRLQLAASDSDRPPNRLRFSLLDPQSWMSLDASSGVLTFAPTDKQADKDHLITVRVTDDGTPPLTDDKTLLVHVPPRKPMLAKTPPAEEVDDSPRPFGAQYRLRFPSGRVLASSSFEIRQVALAEMSRLAQLRLRDDPQVAVIWAGSTAIGALCSRDAPDGRLEGVTITFHDQADPLTTQIASLNRFPRHANLPMPDPGPRLRAGYEHGLMSTMPTQLRGMLPPRGVEVPEFPVAPSLWNVRPIPVPGAVNPHHDECQPRLCANYAAGVKDGMLATWHADGSKEYFGEYAQGDSTGYSCLFKNDRLRVVLEYSGNRLAAVHLVRADQLERTFQDVQLARADDTAGPLLGEILNIRSRVAAEEKFVQQELVTKKPSAKSGSFGPSAPRDPGAKSGPASQKPKRSSARPPRP